uniref:Uncharacterized protein n=2 Tax=Phlebotomus papatasi TaxID=29031 RepID=A0A1B0DDZ6_PHLPP
MLPKCSQCDRTSSVMWWSVSNGEICNECNELKKNGDQDENGSQCEEKSIRKSTRITRMRIKYNAGIIRGIPKGKSRRNIFKKAPPAKTPTITATTSTVESLFFGNKYYQVGDIVSLVDNKYNTYYAQIRGLLQDSFCEKSAVITWLIPTTDSPPPNEAFDPATYLI